MQEDFLAATTYHNLCLADVHAHDFAAAVQHCRNALALSSGSEKDTSEATLLLYLLSQRLASPSLGTRVLLD